MTAKECVQAMTKAHKASNFAGCYTSTLGRVHGWRAEKDSTLSVETASGWRPLPAGSVVRTYFGKLLFVWDYVLSI